MISEYRRPLHDSTTMLFDGDPQRLRSVWSHLAQDVFTVFDIMCFKTMAAMVGDLTTMAPMSCLVPISNLY